MNRLALLFFSSFLITACQNYADWSDKKALAEQCQIPSYASLIEYHGFPAMSGTFQREGLNISGRYLIPKERAKELEASFAGINSEWQALPIPEDILKRLRFTLKGVDLSVKKGFFRCRTAGDNVLLAEQTFSCTHPAGYVKTSENPPRWERKAVPLASISAFSDVIISIYDSEKQIISAGVSSGY